MEKKKKRTILMSEDPSEVSSRSLASKAKSFASGVAGKFKAVKGGVAVKAGPAKLLIGVIRSEARDARGKREGKQRLGAKVKFKF